MDDFVPNKGNIVGDSIHDRGNVIGDSILDSQEEIYR